MAFGFLWFLVARSRDRGYVEAVLIIALAGFAKHNIIAMPLTAFLWLALNRRSEAVKCLCVATIAFAAGSAVCYGLFGRDFFFNLLSPRHYSVKRALHSFGGLKWLSVGLIACICNAWPPGHLPLWKSIREPNGASSKSILTHARSLPCNFQIGLVHHESAPWLH